MVQKFSGKFNSKSSLASFQKPERAQSVEAMDISAAHTPRRIKKMTRILTEDDITRLLNDEKQDFPPYMTECYEMLRKAEECQQLPPDFMRKVQNDITNHMRLILVDWVVEVCEAYRLPSQTLQLSIGLVDQYLSRKPIVRTKLQLLGITAMMLASKVVEIYPPTVGDFVYISDNTYSKKTVLEMEVDMFQTLEHKVTLAVPNDMLGPFGVVMGADEKAIQLASFTIEMSMLEPFGQFALPSQMALAALFLSLRTLGHKGWSKELTAFSKYSLFDVMMLVKDMHTMLLQPRPRKKFNAVIEKYMSSRQCKAALIETIPWVEVIAGSPITTSITSG